MLNSALPMLLSRLLDLTLAYPIGLPARETFVFPISLYYLQSYISCLGDF